MSEEKEHQRCSAGNATERAKAIVEEAWRQTCAGPGEFDDYAVGPIAAAITSTEPQGASMTLIPAQPQGAQEPVSGAELSDMIVEEFVHIDSRLAICIGQVITDRYSVSRPKDK